MSERILIVEDETGLAEAVAFALEQEGFQVQIAGDGATALKEYEQAPPDVVILDIMLPGLSGWDLLRVLNKRQPDVPVIMLTARAEEADRVAGLEMGADDYVTKPFSMRELVARVRAVLRRAKSASATAEAEPAPTVLEVAGVTLDQDRHEVLVEGQRVELAPREFALLAYLMRYSGRVRSRAQILQAVWGEDEYVDERTVDVHIRWLRKKIEADPAHPKRLLTVRGVGYKFAESS